MSDTLPPPMVRLASHSLGQDVIAWCIERRQAVPQPSFRSLSDEIEQGCGIKVHPESLRRWVATLAPTEATA